MTLKELRLPALVLASAVFVAAAAFGKTTESFSKTYPLSAGGSVSLKNMNGDVEVVAWDRAEVSIEAEKSARDDETLKRIEIVVEAEAGRISITTKYAKSEDGSWWSGRKNQGGSVRYTLRVPAELAHLKIDAMNSNVTAENIRGDVKIATMNGKIAVSGLMGSANLDTMNGSIRASFAKLGAGQKVSLDSMNGSCTLDVPTEASARVTASTMNGRVSCDLPVKLEKFSRRSLRGSIGQGEGSVKLDSMNGALNIRARS